MHASNTTRPRARTVVTIMSLITLTIAAACSKSENSTRDTTSSGGTVSGDANTSAQANTSSESVLDDADVKNYRLTMDKVNRFYDAFREGTIAAGNRAQSDTMSDVESIDQIVKEIEREPKLGAAIRRAGLSPREFVVAQFALMTAGMAAEVLKMQPTANVDSLARELEIPAANIRFVREHRAEIEAKGKAAEAAVKAAGVRID